MVFENLYKSKKEGLISEFEKLFEIAKKNQPHDGELSLILFNGYYKENLITNPNITFKPSKYQTGFERTTLAEITHTEFIDKYIQFNRYRKTFEMFKTEIGELFSKDKEQYDKLMLHERISVQQEMLIYLKIWESTQFLKECYQFINIIEGKHYDWEFQIKSHAGDKDGIATASFLIKEHILKRYKVVSSSVYDHLHKSYDTQLRNSIAHSKYHIQGRSIILNNKKNVKGQRQHSTFDEWIEIFHTSLALFKSFSWLRYKIRMHYIGIALKQNNKIEYCIEKKDGTKEYRLMEYHPEIDKWTKD